MYGAVPNSKAGGLWCASLASLLLPLDVARLPLLLPHGFVHFCWHWLCLARETGDSHAGTTSALQQLLQPQLARPQLLLHTAYTACASSLLCCSRQLVALEQVTSLPARLFA